jgi:hypothetical protein
MVMVNDFPILSNPGPTLLFSNYVEFHVYAETKLIPYLNRISKWRRKLRIKFSAAKSVLINFSTQRRKQLVPLLFLFGTKIPNPKRQSTWASTSKAVYDGKNKQKKLQTKQSSSETYSRYSPKQSTAQK